MGYNAFTLCCIFSFLTSLHLASGLQCYECYYLCTDHWTVHGLERQCTTDVVIFSNAFLQVSGHEDGGGANGSIVENGSEGFRCVEVRGQGIVNGSRTTFLRRVGMPYIPQAAVGCKKGALSQMKSGIGTDYLTSAIWYLVNIEGFPDEATVAGCICDDDRCNSQFSLIEPNEGLREFFFRVMLIMLSISGLGVLGFAVIGGIKLCRFLCNKSNKSSRNVVRSC